MKRALSLGRLYTFHISPVEFWDHTPSEAGAPADLVAIGGVLTYNCINGLVLALEAGILSDASERGYRSMTGTRRYRPMALLVGFTLTVTITMAIAAEPTTTPSGRKGIQTRGRPRSRPAGKRNRNRREVLKKGTTAPDFALPLLVVETAKDGTIVNRITNKRIKLSSFRGKKLVCVFFSSYT